jgi:hypothetical protein
VWKDLKMIINVLEDRRIDKWFYQRARGYRPYYEAMYAAMWHSPAIDAALVNPKYAKPVLDSYRMHFINMTNPNMNPDTLPGMREIVDLVDLDRIERFGFDDRWMMFYTVPPLPLPFVPADYPEMLVTAVDILEIIYSNAILPQSDESSSNAAKPPEDDVLAHDERGEGESGDSDADGHSEGDANSTDSRDFSDESSDADGTPEQGDVEAAIQRQLTMLDGEAPKETLDDEVLKRIDAIESAGTELKTAGESLGTKVPVVVYHRLTKALIDSSAFYYSEKSEGRAMVNPESVKAVEEGRRMGAILAHKLRVLADESTISYPRETQGTLDQGLLAELGFGNCDVFARSVEERRAPVSVHLDIDASGSMKSGSKWRKALALAVALIQCSAKVPALHVVVTMRAGGGHEGFAYVTVLYDSKVDKLHKLQLFDYLVAAGSTPEGLCFEALQNLVLTTQKGTRKFFVNLSDGEPSFLYKSNPQMAWVKEPGTGKPKRGVTTTPGFYSGKPAWEHTAAQVRAMRAVGINVLSYFIEEPSRKATDQGRRASLQTAFRTMYGRDAQFINPDNVADVARTLNGMFLAEANMQ